MKDPPAMQNESAQEIQTKSLNGVPKSLLNQFTSKWSLDANI